jgi:tetratricopeptide (TPR) repeat protein
MKDTEEKKDDQADSNTEDAEDQHTQFERKQRHRQIAIVAILIFVATGLIFYENLLDFFIARRTQQSSDRIEKTAKTKMVPISNVERQAFLEKAKVLLDEGEVDDALNLLVKHLGVDPEFAGAHYLAGTAYLRQGQIQSAYNHLRQATKLRPDYYEAQEKLGEIYLFAGDYKSAKDVSSKLARGGEYLQDGLLLESEIALAEGNLDQALQKANAALTGTRQSAKVKSFAYLASLYLRKGEKGKANEIVTKLDSAPMDSEGLLSLAKFYLGAGNDAQAQSFFKQALKRYPDSAEVNYDYGQYLFNKGLFQEAGGYYRKAMAVMPNVQIIAYRLSQCLLAAGQPGEAKAQIEAMILKYPNNVLTLGLKFQYHLLAGERRQAIDALSRMTVLIPNAPRPYIILANLYWQEGMIPLAEKNAFRAMKLGEKTVLPHLMIADILSIKGQFQLSMAYYDRVLEVQPDNLVALLQTGDLYLNLGQPKKAEERYRKAAAAYPQIKPLQTKIAWAKAQGGDVEGALGLNRQSLREAPDDPQAIVAYANTLIFANRLDEAMDTVQKSVKKQPQVWTLQYLLGDLYILKNDFKSAAACYDRALALNSDDVNLALNVGARYEKNALDTKTERYYLEIRRKMPDNLLVANQLAWFYIDRVGTLQKAKELIERLMTEKDRPEMKDTIGWYYFKLGDFVTAEIFFRDALQQGPDHHEIRARLALTLFSLKRNQEATAEAQQVVALMAPSPLRSKLEEAVAQSKK